MNPYTLPESVFLGMCKTISVISFASSLVDRQIKWKFTDPGPRISEVFLAGKVRVTYFNSTTVVPVPCLGLWWNSYPLLISVLFLNVSNL